MSTLIALFLFVIPLVRALPAANETNPSEVVTAFLSTRQPDFEWTAWGDSYASGPAAGEYREGRRCLRYAEAYPHVIQDDPSNLFEGKGGGQFNNVVCSGATSDDIFKYQFYEKDEYWGQPNWQYYPRKKVGKPRMGTISLGGDDVDFPGLLNNCIAEGFPWPLSTGFTTRTCDEQRELTWSLISEKDNHDEPNMKLKSEIDKAITKALDTGKAASKNEFRLYVTGYGQFFNEETTECDSVTFARTANPKDDGKKHIKMTRELRKEYNAMTRTLNKGLQQVINRHTGSNIKYIDIDKLLDGHRFCEPGIKEPDQDNTKLYFFHYPYNKPAGSKQLDDVFKSVAEKYKDEVKFDKKTTRHRDYMEELLSKVKEEDFNAAVSKNDVTAQFDIFDLIGQRAKIFHPQLRFHDKIYEAVVKQYLADVKSTQAGVITHDPKLDPKPVSSAPARVSTKAT